MPPLVNVPLRGMFTPNTSTRSIFAFIAKRLLGIRTPAQPFRVTGSPKLEYPSDSLQRATSFSDIAILW
jgi:hypothetical protein